jgi:hypothetical protein
MAGGVATFTLTELVAAVPHITNLYYGDCSAGYICLEGATTSTPTSSTNGGGYPCPVGYYCPSGTIVPNPCKPGTYNDQTLQTTSCITCPAGYYCPDFAMQVSTTYPCTAGYFCLAGSIYPTPCPAGTFGSPASSVDSTACQACTATKYCDTVGQIDVADFCADGFVCTGGDDRSGPYITTYDFTTKTPSGQCPIGYKCPSGSADATECEATKYQPTTGVASCEYCPPGKYCTGGSFNEDCDEGYYCFKRSSVAAPDTSTAQAKMGAICPI